MTEKVFVWEVKTDGGPSHWVVVAESLENAHQKLVHEVMDYKEWVKKHYEPDETFDSPFVLQMVKHYYD